VASSRQLQPHRPARARAGLTVPLVSRPLGNQREIVELAQALGYTDLWSSETAEADAFTPLALAAVWAPELRLGTAIVPVYTRGPALLAMSFGALAQIAPGRFVAGIGSSSPVIVDAWNAVEFDRPWYRTRDTIRFLRQALAGEKVSEQYETFAVGGFRLDYVPEQQPPIYVAALRESMLRLAGREGDGAILNWLSAEDVRRVAPIVREFGSEKELVARIFVCPSEDEEEVRRNARRFIAAYLNVPAYAAYQEWLGRTDQLGEMWRAWREGDRKAALAAIPDEAIDELIVHGSPQSCREHLQRYVDAGVDTPVVKLMPWGIDEVDALEALGSLRGP
jgi:probable F420-dependent oxidoreductase